MPNFRVLASILTEIFNFLTQSLILRIKEEIPPLRVNGWYLDDGLLAGNKEDLIKAVDILLEEGPSRGLHLSTELSVPGNSKSAVWDPNLDVAEDPLGRGILRIKETGFKHLGAPVGGMEFVADEIQSRISKVKTLLEKLSTMGNSHSRVCPSEIVSIASKSQFLASYLPTLC